jgi:CHAD domain-containing protein
MAASVGGLPAGEVRRRAETRLLGLFKEIREAGSARRGTRRLHFLRTRTKEARYTLEILKERGLTGGEGAILNDRLRDIHRALGRWHDEEIVLESLKEFRKEPRLGPLLSFKSYLEFSRLAKARKAESLECFESAWPALLKVLGRGSGRRILRTPSPLPDRGPAENRR